MPPMFRPRSVRTPADAGNRALARYGGCGRARVTNPTLPPFPGLE
jgi:hypothetical protein